jgi:hypothetical protein
MKYRIVLFSFFLLFIFSCTFKSDQPPNNKLSANPKSDTAIINNQRHSFWEIICQNNRFDHLFDCTTLDCYQVELFQDPFKDLVVLSLHLKDSSTTKIYYNRFSFGRRNKKNKFNFTFPIVNPLTNDTLFCYHKYEKIKTIKIDAGMDTFFKKLIWEMPLSDEEILFDPESWIIKGRKGSKEIILKRHTFKYSLYCENIQSLLDIFKIKDYKYIRPVRIK